MTFFDHLLCLHCLWYKCLQKNQFFDHLPPSSCKHSLCTPLTQYYLPSITLKNSTKVNSPAYMWSDKKWHESDPSKWNHTATSEFMVRTFQPAQLTHERFLTQDHSFEIFFWYVSAKLNVHGPTTTTCIYIFYGMKVYK